MCQTFCLLCQRNGKFIWSYCRMEFKWMKLFKRSGFSSIVAAFSLLPISMMERCWGAPCCARNSATPILIVGDDQAQLNLGVALANVVAESGEDGVPAFGSPNNSDVSQTYRMDGAILLSDRLQL